MGGCFGLLSSFWDPDMGILLYVKTLEGNHSTGQPSQFLGVVSFRRSGAHLGHCMDVKLQGFLFSSLLKSFLPNSTRWMSPHLQHLGELLIHSWWQGGPLAMGVASAGDGINRQFTCFSRRLKGDGSASPLM